MPLVVVVPDTFVGKAYIAVVARVVAQKAPAVVHENVVNELVEAVEECNHCFHPSFAGSFLFVPQLPLRQ